jgi:hypothetical protein
MTASMRRNTDSDRPLLDAALAHAARGWHVFPLRPNDKRPAVAGWETRATTDLKRIERCWGSGRFNIGIATGPSGLAVVDLDQAKPGVTAPPDWRLPGVHWGLDVLTVLAERYRQDLPVSTFRTVTASGGEHLYFTAPVGVGLRNTAGKLGWLIDTRAQGGYVVAAGSVIDGHAYEADDTADLAELPGWLTALLTDAASPPPVLDAAVDSVARRSRYAAAAMRGELDRLLDAPVGQRNHTLNAAAFALGQLIAAGLIPEHLAIDALARAAEATGLGGAEVAATIRSGLTAGAHAPRPAIEHPA